MSIFFLFTPLRQIGLSKHMGLFLEKSWSPEWYAFYLSMFVHMLLSIYLFYLSTNQERLAEYLSCISARRLYFRRLHFKNWMSAQSAFLLFQIFIIFFLLTSFYLLFGWKIESDHSLASRDHSRTIVKVEP
jgi:hypothetical protein